MEKNSTNSKSDRTPVIVGVLMAFCVLMTPVLISTAFKRAEANAAGDIEHEAVETLAMPTTDELLDSFVQEANLTEKDREMIEFAVRSDLAMVRYNPNSPDVVYLDGYGERHQKNLRSEYSYYVSYERVDGGWHAYDWTWVETPRPTLEMGLWTCDIGDARTVHVEVVYEHGSQYGEIPMFRIVDDYNGVVLNYQDWCDYEASRTTGTGCDFIFHLDNGSEAILHIGYDDNITWNDHPLIFNMDNPRGTKL